MNDSADDWLQERQKDDLRVDGALLPGTAVGACRIVALLGRGGFAEVYRGEDADGRPVAIKILHRLDDRSRARFEQETRILLQIRHPNFPRMLSFGSCGERPYVVMEFLRGLELPHGDRPVADFLLTLISAVDELHRHGYVHRDIKPANVLARDDGEPVLIDFGLACPVSKALREKNALSVDGDRRMTVGTPGYSAPEQFSGQATGCEADVHALGALIRDCLRGREPKCWQRILLKATNSNPDVRYPTARDLGRAIRRRHAWRNGLILAAGAALLAVASLVVAEFVQSARVESMPKELPRSDRI